MSQQDPALELIEVLADLLRARGTKWYLFGAQAVMVWGRPRMSADVDVTVRLEPQDTMAFVTAMEEVGFRLRVREVEDFVAKTRVLPFLYRANQLPLDIVLAGPGLEEQFLDRAREVELGGFTAPVISPEDLVVSKVLAGRSKDLEDVRGVLREQRETIDLTRIRGILGLLEQALGQSDLIPLFEHELAAVDRSR